MTFVPVALVKVKPWRDETPVMVRDPAFTIPKVALFALSVEPVALV